MPLTQIATPKLAKGSMLTMVRHHESQTYWALELALHMPREKNGQRRLESRLVVMVRMPPR